MMFHRRRLLSCLIGIIGMLFVCPAATAAETNKPQTLVFQIGIGAGAPDSPVYHCCMAKSAMLTIARQIADVRPAQSDPGRTLGFAVGPIAMDQGAEGASAVIRDAFDIARETGLPVVLHLDDFMFSSQARWPDGRLLRATKDSAEWQDWSKTPSDGLMVGWMPNARLAPQLCYENPDVAKFETYWSQEVIGAEVKRQIDRLAKAGKPELFAGVIAGWESNLSDGYCSLSYLGYSREHPPADFDRERERVLQRHIERWAKGLYDAGIPRERIFTHVGIMPKSEYDKMRQMMPEQQLRKMPGATGMRAFWAAFNDYSEPGFTGYPGAGLYDEIYQAVRQFGRDGTWAMAEGTNVGDARSPRMSWESYLAQSVNHGARLVDVFGAFQGGPGAGPTAGPPAGMPPQMQQMIRSASRSTASEEALAAFRKFAGGGRLSESAAP